MNFARRILDVAITHKWLTGSVLALLVAVFGIGGIYVGHQGQAQAADWSDNAIIRGGISSYEDITKNYDANHQGDLRNILDHYWIPRTVQAGDRVVQGVANNKGEVVAEGRVVARNVSSIGRTEIKHSEKISIAGKTYYQTSHVGGKAFANPNSSLATTVVLSSNGSFKYAIVNDCGNPIWTPEPVTVPEPEPEPAKIVVCDLKTKTMIEIKETDFSKTKHSKNPKDCEEVVKDIKVCELATKKVITIKENAFDSTKHSKNLDDCKEKEITYIKVCELATKKIVQIDEAAFDSTKHSKNLDDCKEKEVEYIKVCELATKEIIQIDKENFDSTKHSKYMRDCEEIIEVCDLKTKTIKQISEKRYDSSKHSTNLADCDKPVVEPPVRVCDTTTKTWVTISKEQAKDSRYSTNPDDCKVVEPTPEKPPVVETPVELPRTGTGSIFGGGVGLTAITIAGYYYWLSRRGL